jgi:Flp pilus assembly protein protease CpaA
MKEDASRAERIKSEPQSEDCEKTTVSNDMKIITGAILVLAVLAYLYASRNSKFGETFTENVIVLVCTCVFIVYYLNWKYPSR